MDERQSVNRKRWFLRLERRFERLMVNRFGEYRYWVQVFKDRFVG